ncbi:MAG: BREX-2 system phosphatase PglZ [Actinomycetota bacterium]|jgi:hypothetical protein
MDHHRTGGTERGSLTLRVATPEQLSALAQQVRAKDPAAGAVGVRADPVWAGPDEMDTAAGPVRVRACPSVLAVRAALHEPGDGLLVVLTDREDHELGLDVLARLTKRRLIGLEPWELLRARLGVTAFDPALSAQAWLADALLQHEPDGGWPSVTTGFLDATSAWRWLRTGWLGLGGERLTLDRIAAWSADPGVVHRLRVAEPELRGHVKARIEQEAGAPAVAMIDLALADRAADVVPFGLAARAVFTSNGNGETATALAQGRAALSYQVLGRQLPTSEALAWADAAEAAFDERLAASGRTAVDGWLVRAEQLLAEVAAGGFTHHSERLPSGFEQRLARAANAALAVLDGEHPAAGSGLEELVDDCRRHFLGRDPAGAVRVNRLVAAIRLVRRQLAAGVPPAGSLAGVAAEYLADGAWVDRCRALLHEGDPSPSVAALFSRLVTAVETSRADLDFRFAGALATWTAMEPGPDGGGVLPIETVLDRVIAVVAASAPVLLVVADGMSIPVALDLADDLTRAGWLPLLPPSGPYPPVVAALPTVTEASRASLLCGARRSGLALDEAAAFSAHAGLRNVSDPTKPPVLFHKAGLRTAGGSVLKPEVREAIADTDLRVVAVVVNAIDDHLARGDQIRVRWDLQTVAPLDALLADATAAGRVLVLTSDHGHVLDRGATVCRAHHGGGERWRPATTAPGEGEVALAGPRVVLGGGHVVVPSTERLRYVGTPKFGYHGGASPVEVLVPLFVLARADTTPHGWSPAQSAAPPWWTAITPPPPLAPLAPAVPVPATEKPTLFDTPTPAPAPATPNWVEALVASEVYAGQRAAAGRQQLDEDRVKALLLALDRRGGSALLATLAADTGIQEFRIRGAVTTLRRLLNVDGYDVVSLADDGTVALNRALLGTQFGIDVP